MRKQVVISFEHYQSLRTEAFKKRTSMYQLLNKILMRYYDPDNEVPTIQEGEPTPVQVKKQTRDHTEDDAFIAYFTAEYIKRINSKVPYIEKSIVYRNIAKPLKHHGLTHLKELLDIYFSRDDNNFRLANWSILTFLSMWTINKLE